jgi:hypothetical protein
VNRLLLLPLVLAAACQAEPRREQVAVSLPRARAHQGPDYDSLLLSGVLTNRPTVSADSARSYCLELEGGWMDPELRPRTDGLASSCETDESDELERMNDRRLFWTRYRHETPLADGPADYAPADTLHEEEIVLFSAPLAGDRRTAEWHLRYDRMFVSQVLLAAAPTDDGGALISVVSCANGTGGCHQQMLLRERDGWSVVRQAWVEQLPDSAGGEFSKGWSINPATLQGEASLYARQDGNCCPSRILYFRVWLRDGAFVLRDFQAVAAGEQ